MTAAADSSPQLLPTLAACCRALGAMPLRLARPRPPDQRLLARLAEPAPLPPARRTVRLTALWQANQSAPTFAVAEGVFRPGQVRMGMASFLVEHPDARLLVDPAVCADVHQRVLGELHPLVRRVVEPERPVTSLADALATVGRTPDDIDFAIPTHLHWDHVSGLLELPDELPVHVQPVEREFVLEGPAAPHGTVRSPLLGRRFVDVALDGPPVLTFPASHDVFGDGSVLLVDLAGHTPGSVGVLLALEDGRRVLLAGDAAWHRLQVTRLRERAPFPGNLVDSDRDAAFVALHRLHALPESVDVVPAHDRDAVLAYAAR